MGDLIDWIQKYAAAVQAIGTVGALVVALLVAWFEHWRSYRREKLQQENTLLRIRELIANFRVLCDLVWDSGQAAYPDEIVENCDKYARRFSLYSNMLRQFDPRDLPGQLPLGAYLEFITTIESVEKSFREAFIKDQGQKALDCFGELATLRAQAEYIHKEACK